MSLLRALPGIALLALAACSIRDESAGPADEAVSICEPMIFEQTPFTVCTAEPGKHAIGMDLSAPNKTRPFGSFAAFSGFLGKDARDIVMAMNGGMFAPDLQPAGYYVEDGRRLMVLNENDGPGNFHLKPNGVFFGSANGGWAVRETTAFAMEAEERPEFATQSGPMLVIDGKLHPAFDHDGESRKIRNGVGVDMRGRALFVLSEAPVSFGKLARFYRDVLKADNALFLDGGVSQLWDRPHGRMDSGADLGPLIVVKIRAQAAP